MQASEIELREQMLASLAGDASAYRALLEAMRARLIPFFARRLARDASELEDLVQETLIAIHAKRATYDPSQPFTAWAYAIARYKLVDHFRRTGRRAAVPLEDAGELFAADAGAATDARLDAERLLGTLTPRSRDLIDGVKLKGWSTEEAAARTGMSPSAVKVAVHRGIQRLAAKVRGQGRGDE